MEEMEDIGRRGFGGLIFLQNIKPSSFWGTKKIVMDEGFFFFLGGEGGLGGFT